jgi:hypothetical protein
MKKLILLALIVFSGCATLPTIPGLTGEEIPAPVDIQAIVDASIERSNALYAQPVEGDELHVWTNERGNVEMDLAAAKVLINSVYELDSYKAVSEALVAENLKLASDLKDEKARKWRWFRNGFIAGVVVGAGAVIAVILGAQ